MGENLRGLQEGLTAPVAPVFVVHSLAHGLAAASAAVEAGRPIVLLSARDAGIYAGPGWFRELVAAIREAVPEARLRPILDCGDDAGAAMAAIRAGVEAIVFTGGAEVAARLRSIADAQGCRLGADRPPAVLDLGDRFFADPETLRRRCAEALASPRAIC